MGVLTKKIIIHIITGFPGHRCRMYSRLGGSADRATVTGRGGSHRLARPSQLTRHATPGPVEIHQFSVFAGGCNLKLRSTQIKY